MVASIIFVKVNVARGLTAQAKVRLVGTLSLACLTYTVGAVVQMLCVFVADHTEVVK